MFEEADAALVGGRREKREGEGAMKERYWSNTYVPHLEFSHTGLDLSSTHLLYQFSRTVTRDCCRKFLQQCSRQRLHKVEVVRLIQALLEVLSYSSDVRKGRGDEVHSWYVW